MYQLIVILFVLLVFFLPLGLLIFYKREIPEKNLPIWFRIWLVLTSFTPITLASFLYILFRKKEYGSEVKFKFNEETRKFAKMMVFVSIVLILIANALR